MITFLIGAALLAAASLALLLWPLRRQEGAAAASRRQINAAIYRDQLADLDVDRADGDLDEADYVAARQELQRRILEDTAEATAAPPAEAPAANARKLAVALSAAIPVVAILLYLLLGNPAGLNPQSAQALPTAAEIESIVGQALKKNPDDMRALWFAGMLAFERGDFGKATEHWERLKKLLPPGSEDARSVAQAVEDARARMNPGKAGE